MSRMLHNWRLKAVALLVASTTWGVVAYARDPVISKDVRGVQVLSAAPPNNWVMVNPLPQVTVTVSGLKQSVDSFAPSSLHASINLDGARLGVNVVKVRVDDSDPEVGVADVSPRSVAVTLDQRDVVTKKVDLRPKNSPNICCVAQNSKGTVTPDSVKLSGPKSVLASAQPYVTLDLSEARSDVTAPLDVKLDGIDSRAAPLVTIEPRQVQATVPVTPVLKTLDAGVHVVDAGQPATGFEVGPVRVTPDIITVQGDPLIIAGITTIDTDPVNITGATSDIVRTVGLRPPAGVTVVGTSTVTVHITIVQSAQPAPSPNPTAAPSPSPSR